MHGNDAGPGVGFDLPKQTNAASRVIHGIALSFTKKWFFGRFFGTVLTFTLLATCGILCVVQGLRGVGI